MTRRMRPGMAALGAVGLALLALLLPLAAPAAAARSADGLERTVAEVDPLRLEVLSFTGGLTPADTFHLRVRVTNSGSREVRGVRVLGSLHRRTFHRFDYAQAVDEGRVGEVWTTFDAELASLPARQGRTVELRRTAAELGFGSGDLQGVYPLVVRLQRSGRTVQETRTSVVLVPGEIEHPVRAALLAPLDAAPTLGPGGTHRPGDLLRELAPRGRLQSVLQGVSGRGDVPVTLALSGRLLDEAADIAGGYTLRRGEQTVERGPESALSRAAQGFLNQVRRAAEQPHTEIVALPYGPADLTALVRGTMAGEATRLISEGRSAAHRHTGARPLSSVLWPPDGLTPAALTEAVNAGVETVVLPETYLELPERRDLPTSPNPIRRLRTAAGRTVGAAVPDPWLGVTLAGPLPADLPVAVQRIIGESAAVYFERPFARDPRGLLLAPPLDWDPPAGFAEGLVRALAAAPWLQPVGLSGLLGAVEPARDPVTVAYPGAARARELPPAYVRELRQARRALGSLAGVLAGDTDTPGRFDRMLLTAASVWFREDRQAGLDLVREVTTTVNDLYGAVHVAEGPTVLLSSVEGSIPVTVENRSPVPLRLLVRLETQRLSFPGGPGRVVTLAPGATQTLAFSGRVRAAGGTFPVRIVVEDTDGQVELADGTVVVRSTAVSATALTVTIGAALFLVVWWLRAAARRRQSRLDHEADTAAPAA